ncbi:MAG: Rv3235 family protein [Promicromonosporaceae bacterium]|nr:Rv3235 family protein [Promicromonosporaceae bacterium]
METTKLASATVNTNSTAAARQESEPIRVHGVPSPRALRPRTRPDGKPTGPKGPATRPPDTLPSPLAPIRVVKVGDATFDHHARPVSQPTTEPVSDPTQMAGTVIRAAVEVLEGRRALHQIRQWLTPEVAFQLQNRARLEMGRPARHRSTGAIRIRRVNVVTNGDSAEATVILEAGERVRAAAARLEARHGIWRVAMLEIA